MEPRLEAWAMKWLRVMVNERFETQKQAQESSLRRSQALDEKLHRLIDMRASGELEQAEFMMMKKNVADEKEKLKKMDEKVLGQQENWLEDVEKELALSTSLLNRFDKADSREKKEIIRTIGSNFSYMDGKVTIEAKKQYVRFRQLQSVANLSLEPTPATMNTAQVALLDQTHSSWLGERESNPHWRLQRPLSYR